MVIVAETEKQAKHWMHKLLSAAVKESEPKIHQLGSLLVLNIFSVCSQPHFCLYCSLWQILLPQNPTAKMPSICQCLNQIQTVPGALLHVRIKKFYQPAWKSHSALAYVLLFVFVFGKFTKYCFSQP